MNNLYLNRKCYDQIMYKHLLKKYFTDYTELANYFEFQFSVRINYFMMRERHSFYYRRYVCLCESQL